MPDQAYHMVHYREFSVATEPPVAPLEQLARAQLSAPGPSETPRWESISDRMMDVGDGSGFELVLNRVADLSSAIFGEMCLIHRSGVHSPDD